MFSEIFGGDREFWRQIAKEEIEHSALINMAIEYPDAFPKELSRGSLEEIKQLNQDIVKTIEEYKSNPPSKDGACAYALKLESSAWELHYQQIATALEAPEAIKLFQKINDGDKDHLRRISEFRNKK